LEEDVGGFDGVGSGVSSAVESLSWRWEVRRRAGSRGLGWVQCSWREEVHVLVVCEEESISSSRRTDRIPFRGAEYLPDSWASLTITSRPVMGSSTSRSFVLRLNSAAGFLSLELLASFISLSFSAAPLSWWFLSCCSSRPLMVGTLFVPLERRERKWGACGEGASSSGGLGRRLLHGAV
jgi:hypothetical protein